MRSKSPAPATRRTIPSRTPELAPRPRITLSSCASSETANISPIAVPIAAMSRAIGGGSAEGSGIGGGAFPRSSGGGLSGDVPGCSVAGRGLVAQMQRGVLRGVRPVVLVAGRQLFGCRRRRSLKQRAHLVDVREDEVLGILKTPTLRESTARCQRGTTHQPGRPDVSVDTA